MGQISMKISALPGSVLSENQHSFIRARVRIVSVDAGTRQVTYADARGGSHTVPVREPSLWTFAATLKPGDTVDVTTMEAVSFLVTNRVIQPQVSVSETGGVVTVGPGGAH